MANNNNKDKCNVPHLRFPEFTGEWKMATFGDIAKGWSHGGHYKRALWLDDRPTEGNR